ncbi:MAG: nicotinamide-nucleotide amidohydrolase family protein, partial [Priestia megaterium]
TTVSGAGEVVKGSLVAYHYEIKQNILGVSEHTLNQYGAVSEQCAAEMAQRIQQLCKTDIGIGFTGVAGPSKQEGHPVGTVYIGVAYKDQAPQVYSLQLSGSRQGIRSRTVNYGCHYVLKMIKK